MITPRLHIYRPTRMSTVEYARVVRNSREPVIRGSVAAEVETLADNTRKLETRYSVSSRRSRNPKKMARARSLQLGIPRVARAGLACNLVANCSTDRDF